MKLIYKHNQENHFKIIRYPDGQQSVELDLSYYNDKKSPMDVLASIRNFTELEVFLCLIAAVRKQDFCIRTIRFNYLLGMRSDRSFSGNDLNYFRDVLAPIINGLNVPRIEILHPHNWIIPEYIKGGCYVGQNPPSDIFYPYRIGADRSAVSMYWQPHFVKSRSGENVIVKLAKDTKHFLEVEPHLLKHDACKDILIYDDLCDGGATFIAVAEYLQEHYPKYKRNLYITHGLFTKGIDHVAAHYDNIFTTNSYQEFDHPKVFVTDVWS